MLSRVGLLYGGIRRDFSPAFLQLIYLEVHPRTLHLCTQYTYIYQHNHLHKHFLFLLLHCRRNKSLVEVEKTNRGVGTGEAGEASASPDFRCWLKYCFEILGLRTLFHLSCLTWNYTVPRPLTIVLLNKEPDPIKIGLLNKEPDQNCRSVLISFG